MLLRREAGERTRQILRRASPPGGAALHRGYFAATLAAAALFASLFAVVIWQSPRPRLIWNASASVPVGLYRIDARTPALGDLIAIIPPPTVADWLDRRDYLPLGTPLLKHVAATPGARVCRWGAKISIDGRHAAFARAADRRGRALPRWRGCRTLRHGELFLLNAASDSLDSRYFGPLPVSGLLGPARPILTRSAPGSSLRWRSHGLSRSFHPKKDYISC
ncbi:S26 family signal peptidase [Sphingopyxis flava]|uniref:Conjugative transfer signal peptidase TraF n=1 Tax=Sphingopyxis flava TaxID=1507287 RepID=A0A1T5DT19_9SPHN|nr:S26 family signal peptidase [Sphingopyxis flava]SKB74888.1 conjugative transfer signal peptidase TraF [Sphingopyxis flava]